MSIAETARRAGATPARVGLVALVNVAILAAHWWYGIRHEFFDLKIYRAAMAWWADGNELYDYTKPDETQGQLGFTYPPFAALLIRPFAGLFTGVWVAVYIVVTVAILALVVWWLVTPVADRHGWPRWFAFGLAFPLATALEPVRETFSFGQINIVLVGLIVADLLVFRDRRWAGVGIGLATALKLVPGIFILYLLAARRFRAAAVATGTFVGASLLAAVLAPAASKEYWTHVLWQGEGVGKLAYPPNQSVNGLLARLAAPEDPSRLWWALLVVPILAYGLWRAAKADRAGDAVVALTLAGLTGSLISPVTWIHHIFWLVPALIVLVDTGRRAALAAAALIWLTVTVSLLELWQHAWGQFGGPAGFVIGNWDVLIMIGLLAALPIRAGVTLGAGRTPATGKIDPVVDEEVSHG